MATQAEDDNDTLTEAELAKLKRNLLLLSGSSVASFYQDAHWVCSLERKPNPKAMQQTGYCVEDPPPVGLEVD